MKRQKLVWYWMGAAMLLAAVLGLPAWAGSPQLNNLHPVVAQRGQTIDVTFYGARLNDATRVLFHTEGITAGDVVFEKNRVKTSFTLTDDTPIGEHRVRLLTKSGVTEMVTFHVVDRPVVNEKRDERIKDTNRFRQATSFEDPQVVELGTTILGRTEAEDIDYYAVDLKKGQRLTVQVDGMRLGRGFTDSYLAVLDAERFEIASSDDTTLLRQDPYVSFLAPADGRYVIVIRDSGYGGDNNNWYAMHLGTFPRPAIVFPLGGKPGDTVALRFLGDPAGEFEQQITLPDQPNNQHVVTPVQEGQAAPSGHAFRVNHLPNVFEPADQRNDSMSHMDDHEAYDAPVAFNGIIEKPGDMDYFKLRLKKGQAVTINTYAGEMGSPLDTVLNVWRVDNKQHLVGSDDKPGGSDSTLTLTAPVDGAYFVRVRDHRNRGGEQFVYRIEVTTPSPSLTTSIWRYDQNAPQRRQAIAIPQGNRFAALVRVNRQNVGGDLTPAVDGLPTGVTFSGLGPAQRGELMPVVFEAQADAPMSAAFAAVHALSQPKDESAKPMRSAFHHGIPTVMANPNRTEYAHTAVQRMPVAVTEAVPIRIDVVPPKAPLVRGGVMNLKVNVTRDGFDGRVRAYMLYRPAGIGAAGQIDLVNGKTGADYRIDANDSTPTRAWPMVVYGYGELPGGPVWVSSDLFYVNVEEPFVTGKLAKAKCTRGEAVDVVLKLEHPRDWTGEGEIKLLGLPAECKVEPVMVKPGQKQAVFRVQTTEKSPPGQHKSLMAELTITINGEPVVHRMARGGQLRIDKPRTERTARADDGSTNPRE